MEISTGSVNTAVVSISMYGWELQNGITVKPEGTAGPVLIGVTDVIPVMETSRKKRPPPHMFPSPARKFLGINVPAGRHNMCKFDHI